MRVAFNDIAKPGMRNGGCDAIADRYHPVIGLLQNQAVQVQKIPRQAELRQGSIALAQCAGARRQARNEQG
ncbi:hypothetical protein D3C80_2165060 [compost metagenome]